LFNFSGGSVGFTAGAANGAFGASIWALFTW